MKKQLSIFFPILVVFAIIVMGHWSCNQKSNWKESAENPEILFQGVKRITEIIKFDIFSPPVASRIYAYSMLSGYEAMRPGYPEYKTMAGILPDFPECPAVDLNLEYCFPLSGISAMIFTAKALVFSENKVSDLEDEFFQYFSELGIPADIYERSILFGKSISEHVLAWSKTDNYAQTRSLPKYTIKTDDPSRWVPTPPSYADALEPYWMTQRLWAVDSLTQFQVAPPIPFSTEKGSKFYEAAYEVYEVAKNLTKEQEATAWYWDDNPYAVDARGHLMAARKKTSPPGHWMNIASAACREGQRSIMESMSILFKTSVALMDGFIMTWQEKFRTNLLRPETYINKYIDPDFKPIIETPPFPEHPSGHSTISAAAAAVLGHEFGDVFTFVDSTEVEFGMDPRTYTSFMEAAREAAVSRLYGGIHYRHGNVSGLELGLQIGTHVFIKLQNKEFKVPPGELMN